jgi:AmiR/NasT family two-component response regulator
MLESRLLMALCLEDERRVLGRTVRAGGRSAGSIGGLYFPVGWTVESVMGEATHTGQRELRILLADEDTGALKLTAAQMQELGHIPTEIAVDLRAAAEAIARDDPDLTIVAVYEDDRHALDLIEEISAYSSGPVIALMDREDADFVAAAAERGIFAYARQKTTESIQSAIEVAMRRWREQRDLTEQVTRLENALARRALIERAKGILMERHGIDERAAFERMREHARSRNRTVVDVAASVAEGHALLPKERDRAG